MSPPPQKKLDTLLKLVRTKLGEPVASNAWPITVLATVVPLDVDAYEAITDRTMGGWESDSPAPAATENPKPIKVARRTLTRERLPLEEVRHELELEPSDVDGVVAGDGAPSTRLEEFARAARRRQVADLVASARTNAETLEAFDIPTLIAKVDEMPGAKTLLLFGTLPGKVKDAIADHNVTPYVDSDLQIDVNSTPRRVRAVLFAGGKPVTLYRAFDVAPSAWYRHDDDRVVIEVTERRAYLRSDRPKVVVFLDRPLATS